MTDFNGILGKYYYYFFSTNFYERAMRMTAKGTVDSVRLDMISKMDIKMPKKISEQKKIADCLTKLDNLITLHQRKIQLYNRFMTIVWEQRKLGKIFVSMQNNTLSRADLSYDSGVAMNVHYGDILVKFGEVLDIKSERLPMIVDETVLDKYKSSFLKNGDIIIADTAEDETVGKCTEIAGLSDEYVISGLHTIPYRPLQKFAFGYLGYYMNSTSYHNQLLPLMQGIKVTSISKVSLQNTVIIYPKSKVEQAAIGKYFYNLDNLITLHQWKWYFFDKKVGNAWEQRKLGELASIYDGVHKTPNYKDSGIMFLSVENIITLKSKKYISEEDFERDYKVHPERGDIFMTRIGDVGTTNVVESSEKLAFYVSLALLKPIDSYPYFLNNAMKTNDFQMKLRKRTLVTAIPQKINKDEIGKLELFITYNFVEQKKIGDYFRKLDQLITLHQWKWFVYGKIRGIVWIQRKSIKILVIQRKYTLLRVVIVFEWFIICCVCFENIQLRFIAVIEFKIFCIIVDEYVVLIVIECIYVIVVFEVYYALLEFVLIIKSCYVFDDGLFL